MIFDVNVLQEEPRHHTQIISPVLEYEAKDIGALLLRLSSRLPSSDIPGMKTTGITIQQRPDILPGVT